MFNLFILSVYCLLNPVFQTTETLHVETKANITGVDKMTCVQRVAVQNATAPPPSLRFR